ncbi:hypothetical protein JCM9140_418 [Halalkalibacter wakoensis JCM 9140]|uniref:Lipoprotein n=1 Tax=Halalkalibacter wakoensis JCM 9140 TaxID=1236970 RepID=W4PXT8_9BACI|nr:hypothetical protein [Halalkalibacter wakoensis]GAE24485.1 hypothetical protein JCM9140_418 [Halalkalibacter wakoensis JCM 9140]
MKRLTFVTLLISSLLFACGVEHNEHTPTMSNQKEENNLEDSLSSDASQIKPISVFVEGETEMRDAQFHRGGLGYSIYILQEGYLLDSEEPNRDVILSTFDRQFFTRITVHETYDAQSLREDIMNHATGPIQEAEDVPLDDTEYALVEKSQDGSESIMIMHVAKEYNGHLLQFTLFLPQTEAVEGIEPSMWAMLQTVEF